MSHISELTFTFHVCILLKFYGPFESFCLIIILLYYDYIYFFASLVLVCIRFEYCFL